MTSKTLIAQSAIIENKKFISPAVINIENGIITNISNKTSFSDKSKIIELEDTFLLPGFVNGHCHLEVTALGPLSNHSFVPWILELDKKRKSLSKKEWLNSVHHGITMLLKSGVTTILDHISFDAPQEAYANSPVRIIGFGEVLGAKLDIARQAYSEFTRRKDLFPIPLNLSPHGVHSLHENILKVVFEKEPKPFSVHLAENEDEREYFHSHSGPLREFINHLYPELKNHKLHDAPSAIQYLEKKDYPLNSSLLIHTNQIDETDIEIIKKWDNCCIVHCPGSYHFFDNSNFSYSNFKSNHIPVALGTDSLCSNTNLSMLYEIQLFLQEHPNLNILELLPMITTNACQAIGLKNVGMIKEGFSADIIGFKNCSENSILETLKNSNQVDFIMSKGEIL